MRLILPGTHSAHARVTNVQTMSEVDHHNSTSAAPAPAAWEGAAWLECEMRLMAFNITREAILCT